MANHFAIPYESVEFVWVSDHWDIHLRGLCRFHGELCSFKTLPEIGDNLFCELAHLGPLQKVRWLLRKKMFEWCVGYHWTYPHRKNGAHFHMRRPRWWFKFLYRCYYWRWSSAW